jgi:hypothetical protein
MLSLPHVLNFFMNEFPGRGRRRFSFPEILLCASNRFLFWHRIILFD